MAEGKRLIKDAIFAGLTPRSLIVSDESHLDEFGPLKESHLSQCSIYRVPYKDLSTWSSLTTCPGIVGIFNRPHAIAVSPDSLPITVICDNIREPNNLGSIFRVCAALCARQVVIMKGCADPWEAKCLRGGCGGQFHIPITYPVRWEDIDRFVSRTTGNVKVFLAENVARSGCSTALKSIDENLALQSDDALVVVIGGETHGVSEEAYRYGGWSEYLCIT